MIRHQILFRLLVLYLSITGTASVDHDDILMLSSRIDILYKKVAGLGKDVSSLGLNLETYANESLARSSADKLKYAQTELEIIPINGLSKQVQHTISVILGMLRNEQQLKSDQLEMLEELQVLKEDVSMLRTAIEKDSACCDLQHQIDQLRAEFNKKPNRTMKDCADILVDNPSSPDGVYTIDPDGTGPFKVYCDMTTAGGGWTVFQRRQDGSVDFYKYWADYKAGFGEVDAEFWLGNDKISRLTSARACTLRIDMKDHDDKTGYATYSSFSVGSASSDYRLSVSGFHGDRGDSLAYHNGMRFSTRDEDHDNWGGVNCAESYKGAWWYESCTDSHLNGNFNNVKYGQGITWYKWHGPRYSLKFVEMKLRAT